jgi:uncharacterized protein YjiS (DUF1127 family)
MIETGVHWIALASLAGIERAAAAFSAWRRARRDRRALEGLSEEQLKDIGFRRVPGDPPHYHRLDD